MVSARTGGRELIGDRFSESLTPSALAEVDCRDYVSAVNCWDYGAAEMFNPTRSGRHFLTHPEATESPTPNYTIPFAVYMRFEMTCQSSFEPAVSDWDDC